MRQNSNLQYELSVIMPVYNESACIKKVIDSWIEILTELRINFILIIINDGSTDTTINTISCFQHNKNIEIVNKFNSGHGPTILMGYKKVINNTEWVFQCDSDNEMEARHFSKLWKHREHYAAVFGIRTGRVQNLQRKLISMISRFIVKILFGKNVVDVNVPYRLIRSYALKPILPQILPNTFAPNIIIAGALSKANLPILNIPIPIQPRQTGTVSIMKWGLWRASFLSFWQIMYYKDSLKL